MRIKKIPSHIIKRIAAGEVIIRPLNVVKELVENSIDANATSIQITFENGGIERIEVRDDGDGIRADELSKAFQLHTSNKIHNEEIEDIATLGFRGEALASIATVCKVKCRSRFKDCGKGRKIIIENMDVIHERDVQMPNHGTITEVLGIFYNVPVRRKFLKSAVTEKRAILNYLMHVTLTYFDIHWIVYERIKKKKNKLFESQRRREMLSAIYDVLGNSIGKNLIKLKGDAGKWKVEGFISKPILVRKDRSMQFIRINGRPVNNLDISKAIEASYSEQLLKSNFPVIIIDLVGEFHWIDFNIHPQKFEIQFQKNDNVLEKLVDLVKHTLQLNSDLPEFIDKAVSKTSPIFTAKHAEQIQNKKLSTHPELEMVSEGNQFTSEVKEPKIELSSIVNQLSLNDYGKNLDHEKLPSKSQQIILGHIMQKFAVINSGTELWLMDVHAADERIKFEMYEKSKHIIMSQQLLEPLEISLSSVEADFIEEVKDVFKKFGLIISTTNSSKALIHSTPAYFDQKLSRETITSIFQEVLNLVNQTENYSTVETPLDKLEYYIVSRLACYGSIRSGYPVSSVKLSEILNNLLRCKHPWTCAHGRPTILRFKQLAIEGWFKR